jgi:hypothetical protein
MFPNAIADLKKTGINFTVDLFSLGQYQSLNDTRRLLRQRKHLPSAILRDPPSLRHFIHPKENDQKLY